jgi:glutathione S-transferase
MNTNTVDLSNWENSNAKVEYFPLNGKGALIRAVLYYKQAPFADVRHTFEDWQKLKKSGDYEFEQLPAFEFAGQKFVQSGAIVLMLARHFNLLGSNLNEEYLNYSLLSSIDDFGPKFAPAFFAMTPEGQAQMEVKKKEFKEVHASFFLTKFESRFKKHGGKYAVGDSFSLSDIIFTVMLTNVFKHPLRKEEFEPLLNEHAPTLAKHIENVAQNELAEFFAKGFIGQAPI